MASNFGIHWRTSDIIGHLLGSLLRSCLLTKSSQSRAADGQQSIHNSCITLPTNHKSARIGLNFIWPTSGVIYLFVPAWPSSNCFSFVSQKASPKSTTVRRPYSKGIRRLEGLRSIWATLWSCMNLTASKSCVASDHRWVSRAFKEVRWFPATGMAMIDPPVTGQIPRGRTVWLDSEDSPARYWRISISLPSSWTNFRHPTICPSLQLTIGTIFGCCTRTLVRGTTLEGRHTPKFGTFPGDKHGSYSRRMIWRG